jgi:hypothetical protein
VIKEFRMWRLLAAAVAAMAWAAPSLAQGVNFDTDKPGAAPQGWTIGKTGRGDPKWTVEADAGAPSGGNVLKQSGKATYPVALLAGSAAKDGFVEVKLKAISGGEDRAGGVIWRARDTDNYYIARANALEDNVVLYKTVAGKRSSVDLLGQKGTYGVKAPVPPNQWHTLRVEFSGARFKVIFNGQMLFEAEDKTFANAGQVGLWTKADSETVFDDFAYGAAK